MANFFAELKRRHIYRVGAAYVVAAWAVAQVIDLLSQVFALPSWIAQPTIIVIAVGFPIALLVTWVVESKPQQVIASAVRSKPTTLDWMLFGAVAVLIAVSGYRLIAPSDTPTRQADVDAVRSAASSPASAISIAVLPFANLSGDAQQEFFSDGITEEITSALARVPDLRVVARTSAYQFRDQNRDIQSIGQQLHATHFIEGSVRKAGDRVRITAQLIETDNGLHLWTESYDRQLTDIFATQEDIAHAIADALQVPLGLRPGDVLVRNRTNDLESYQQYLQGRALVRARLIPDAIAVLEPVVTRDPDYAPAWAMLAQAYDLTPNRFAVRLDGSVEGLRRVVDEFLPKAERAAGRAIQLDANLADGHVSLARVHDRRGKFLLAEDLYSKALTLDPYSPDALQAYSLLLASMGRVKEAVVMRQRLQALEPFVPVFNFNTALVLWLDGQNDNAVSAAKALPAGIREISLAQMYAAAGRYREAADALETTDALVGIFGNDPSGVMDVATRLLRAAPAPATSPQTLPRLGPLEFVYLYVGAPSRAFEWREGELEAGYLVSFNNAILWHPIYAPVRKMERFKAFVQRAGFVDYWRARGWPEFCRPIGADDFACE